MLLLLLLMILAAKEGRLTSFWRRCCAVNLLVVLLSKTRRPPKEQVKFPSTLWYYFSRGRRCGLPVSPAKLPRKQYTIRMMIRETQHSTPSSHL